MHYFSAKTVRSHRDVGVVLSSSSRVGKHLISDESRSRLCTHSSAQGNVSQDCTFLSYKFLSSLKVDSSMYRCVRGRRTHYFICPFLLFDSEDLSTRSDRGNSGRPRVFES